MEGQLARVGSALIFRLGGIAFSGWVISPDLFLFFETRVHYVVQSGLEQCYPAPASQSPASLTSDVPTWVTSVISQGFMLSSPPQPQCEPKILRQPPGSRVPWFPKGSQLSVGPECVAAAPVLSLPCSREPIST